MPSLRFKIYTPWKLLWKSSVLEQEELHFCLERQLNLREDRNEVLRNDLSVPEMTVVSKDKLISSYKKATCCVASVFL